MKLRGKKTGEIVELKLVQVHNKYSVEREVSFLNGEKITLQLLINNFDDVEEEPLIKNKEVREAIRAWAKVCSIEKCSYDGDGEFYTKCHRIVLDCSTEELSHGIYSIAELCGEEEE